MTSENLIIIFTRYPSPGTTKTRLIPTLGPEGAAALQQQMTEHITRQCLSFIEHQEASLQIYHHGGCNQDMTQWLGPHHYTIQPEGDLGSRISSALTAAINKGFGKIIILGSDCPGITPDLLQKALLTLTETDLVLGPAHDGGYYLIGLKQDSTCLFEDISWGTNMVLQQTIKKAQAATMTIGLLEVLNDIDRPEDIKHFSHHSNS